MRYIAILVIISMSIFSCTEEQVTTPKPRMYPKIDFPERDYTSFDFESCPFTFSTIRNSKVTYTQEAGQITEACWFDIKYPGIDAELNFSYFPISRLTSFDAMVEDAFSLVNKHNVKAEYIVEDVFQNKNGNGGMVFQIDGPVASPIQFFVSDTTHHFVRASLYFNSKVDRDSLQPMITFMRSEVDHILDSFVWRDHE